MRTPLQAAQCAGMMVLVCVVGLLSVRTTLSTQNAVSTDKIRHSSYLERDYQEWLSTFQAADPQYQAYCMQVLESSVRFPDKGAQLSQDIFLFKNFFKYWPMQNKTGFYVESGANDALALSTSLFFDKCLGWDGLCIEPQPQYHQVTIV